VKRIARRPIGLAIVAPVLAGCLVVTGTAAAQLPPAIQDVMEGPRYRTASWSLYAADVETGRPLYSLRANRRSFTGSTRKLMSVGLALDALGANGPPPWRQPRAGRRG
jgi:D-alanyl-D-alanine carboxypeptidase